MATKQLIDLLDSPPSDHWAVDLELRDRYHHKEYRIIVDGTTVTYRWGRIGTGHPQHKRVTFDTPQAATQAARKQWAAKEKKGYWPVTGVIHGTREELSGHQIDQTRRARAGELERTGQIGEHLWLCQAPPRLDATNPIETLNQLSIDAKLTPETQRLNPFAYFLLAVDEHTSELITQILPVAIRIGTTADTTALQTAQIARQLAKDDQNPDISDRLILNEALEVATLVNAD